MRVPDRSTRLASIILMLRAAASLTAEDLAARLGVAVRTVYRDIDDLVASGVPIRGVRGREGGYELAEHYPIDPHVYVQADPPLSLGRSSADIGRSLDVATDLLSQALPPRERELVTRLRERFLFDTSAWLWQDTRLVAFHALKLGVLRDETLELVFADRSGGGAKSDTFDPLGLVWRQGHWYLVAYSHAREKMERHRVTRILAVKATGKRFTRQTRFNLSSEWTKLLDAFGRGSRLVRIRIDAPATHDFESFAWKRDQKIHKFADHWIVEMELDEDDWLVPLVMSYGTLVRVLEPADLQQRIIEAHRAAIHSYGKESIAHGAKRGTGRSGRVDND
jgi:predicted DNA-binding transcriptional regulator YafY